MMEISMGLCARAQDWESGSEVVSPAEDLISEAGGGSDGMGVVRCGWFDIEASR